MGRFQIITRSSSSEEFLGKGVLKLCSKFIGEHLCQGAISVKLYSNFIEIALRHVCSPVSLLHIFRKFSPKNTSGRLRLDLPAPPPADQFLLSWSHRIFSKSRDLAMMALPVPSNRPDHNPFQPSVSFSYRKWCKSNGCDLKEVRISFFISAIRVQC